MAELAAQTNPQLAEGMAQTARLEAMGIESGSAVTPGELGAFREAIRQLDRCDEAESKRLLKTQLLGWANLGRDARIELLVRVDRYVSESRAREEAAAFVRSIVPTYPGNAGILTLFLTLAVFGSAFFWLPVVRDWLWGTILVGVALAVGFLLGALRNDRARFRWCAKTLIPKLQANGVDPVDFLGILFALEGRDDLDEGLEDMVNSAEAIASDLVCLEVLPPPDEDALSKEGGHR
ncbi:MAG: hypothetical protein R3F11_11355 [Verrucomicrobiales bacterium]